MPLEGQHVDRYHILHLLGGSGMGDVYLAEDPPIGQQVAIKVIPPSCLYETQLCAVQMLPGPA